MPLQGPRKRAKGADEITIHNGAVRCVCGFSGASYIIRVCGENLVRAGRVLAKFRSGS